MRTEIARMQRRRRQIIMSGAVFSPSGLSKVTAWLRHTSTTGDLTTWPSQLDNNDATANASRAPAAGASAGNSRPIATWVSANNDAVVWPLNGTNNHTTKWGFATWIRQPTSALETIFAVYTGTNGASARKLYLQTNTSRRLVFGAYISGSDGRQAMTAVNALPAAGTWVWVRFAYDSAGATEADKIKIYVGGVQQLGLTFANLGAGGTLGALPAPTGNAIFGNLSDGTSLLGFNGDIAQNVYIFNDDLTAAEETNLMNFEAPT